MYSWYGCSSPLEQMVPDRQMHQSDEVKTQKRRTNISANKLKQKIFDKRSHLCSE